MPTTPATMFEADGAGPATQTPARPLPEMTLAAPALDPRDAPMTTSGDSTTTPAPPLPAAASPAGLVPMRQYWITVALGLTDPAGRESVCLTTMPWREKRLTARPWTSVPNRRTTMPSASRPADAPLN